MTRGKRNCSVVFVGALTGGESTWQFSSETNHVICQLCIVAFNYHASIVMYQIDRHVETREHQKRVTLKTEQQQSFFVNVDKTSIFHCIYGSFRYSKYSIGKDTI